MFNIFYQILDFFIICEIKVRIIIIGDVIRTFFFITKGFANEKFRHLYRLKCSYLQDLIQ